MTDTAIAVALALVAAALFGSGTALQSSAAQGGNSALHPELARRLVASPRWLAGTFLDVLGVLAHLGALRYGPLVLVQPLALSGLLFALPLEAGLGARRLSRHQVLAAFEVVAGLALVVAVNRSVSAEGDASPSPTAIVVALILLFSALIGACLRDGSMHRPRLRAVCLGTAAGASLGLSSVLGRQATLALSTGGVGALWSTGAAGFAISGLLGVLLSQAGFASGQLSWSLPAQDVTALLTSIAAGAAILGEVPRLGRLAICADVAALLALAHGLSILTRRSDASAASPADDFSWRPSGVPRGSTRDGGS